MSDVAYRPSAAEVKELREQTQAVLKGKEVEPKVYPHQVAFNVRSDSCLFR